MNGLCQRLATAAPLNFNSISAWLPCRKYKNKMGYAPAAHSSSQLHSFI